MSCPTIPLGYVTCPVPCSKVLYLALPFLQALRPALHSGPVTLSALPSALKPDTLLSSRLKDPFGAAAGSVLGPDFGKIVHI